MDFENIFISCRPSLAGTLTFSVIFLLFNFPPILPLVFSCFSPFTTHDMGWEEASENIFTQLGI